MSLLPTASHPQIHQFSDAVRLCPRRLLARAAHRRPRGRAADPARKSRSQGPQDGERRRLLRHQSEGLRAGPQLDSGDVLAEAATVVQYVADQAPQGTLAPAAGTLERYRLQEWLTFISSEIHKGFGPL